MLLSTYNFRRGSRGQDSPWRLAARVQSDIYSENGRFYSTEFQCTRCAINNCCFYSGKIYELLRSKFAACPCRCNELHWPRLCIDLLRCSSPRYSTSMQSFRLSVYPSVAFGIRQYILVFSLISSNFISVLSIVDCRFLESRVPFPLPR